MGRFTKGKIFIASGVGAVVGGLSVFYGVNSIYGFPVSKWDYNWDKLVLQTHILFIFFSVFQNQLVNLLQETTGCFSQTRKIGRSHQAK